MIPTQRLNIKLKWAYRIVCAAFLGLIGITLLIIILLMFLSFDGPNAGQEKTNIFNSLLPIFSILTAGCIGGLTWNGIKAHHDQPNSDYEGPMIKNENLT